MTMLPLHSQNNAALQHVFPAFWRNVKKQYPSNTVWHPKTPESSITPAENLISHKFTNFFDDRTTIKILVGYPASRMRHELPNIKHYIWYPFIHPFTHSLFGPLKNLASIIMDAHSSLSTAFCPHLLTFISHRSFSTSSSHLNPSLPLRPLMSSLLPNIFLTVLPWSILTTCPIHSNLFSLISAAMSRPLYISLSSWLVIILQIPYSTTGPNNLLNILLSNVLRLFISIPIKAHVSLPHTTTGFTIVLYNLILTGIWYPWICNAAT